MRMYRVVFALALFLCCLVLFAGSAAVAASKKPVPPPDIRKLVKSVDKRANSITIVNQRTRDSHRYRLDDLTTIQVDGASAKFSDIKAGMEVADSTERDSDDLDSLSLLSKTHAPVLADLKAAEVTGSTKTIQAVLADKQAVVIFFAGSKIARTYHIDTSTALTVNGVPGAFSDIKAGMEVKDYAERDSDDLDSLTVMGGY